ncbi:MAG TPA: response regulator [Flavisolibacter sp.]|jgi:CheY-like chemotaxis protein|nr:response regulator [Flavisolibacter sp.]
MSKSIISVNNNRAMNYLLQTIFEKEYKFVPAGDVFQAMHHLRSVRNINALIVDIDFQPQQSWELVQHIKSSKLYNIPVIVLTTANSDDLKQKCYEFEVDEIFFKPFNPVDLIAAVKSLVTSGHLSKV